MNAKLVELPISRKIKQFNVSDLSTELQEKINDENAKNEEASYLPERFRANHIKDLNKIVSHDYTNWQLKKAFDLLIKKDQNWKDEISIVINESDYEICDDACSLMTGGMLQIFEKFDDKTIHVYSEGYYYHIGS
jgi:hypothetical protein